jgi:hypothetical protein
VAVPLELVAELVAECGARPVPDGRGLLTDVALIVGGNATSLVVLTLTAKNVARLRRAVAELTAATASLKLHGRFGNRDVELDVSQETSSGTIAEFITTVETPVEIEPHLLVPGVTVFISYAHDSAKHVDLVRQFWRFLRLNGIDARIDLWAAREPRDWTVWTHEQIRLSTFVLMVASPAYKRRAEGGANSDDGRGVQWESRLLREMRYRNPEDARRRQLPVVLPGGSADELPDWAGPAGSTRYVVRDFTADGATELLHYIRSEATPL